MSNSIACTCTVPKLCERLWPGTSRIASGGSVVLVDHPGESSSAPDRGAHWDHYGRVLVGWQLVPSLMRTMVIEVVRVLADHGQSVSLVVDQQVVGALGAEAAAPPLDEAVRPGCAGRDLDHLDAVGFEDVVEAGGVLAVAVTDEEPERVGPLAQVHDDIPGLLDHPLRGGVSGYAEQVDPPGGHLHHHQHVQPSQQNRVQVEEVDGQQTLGLAA